MPNVRSRVTRSARRGQTLTEFALIVPVLFLLIMGVLDAGLLMFSVGTARYAAAEGSRVAAQLGNVSTTDTQVLQTIRSTVSGTQLFSVGEIDIYRLSQDGAGNLTQDISRVNRYRLDGSLISSPLPWPPANRNVGNGTSDFVGVTINYTYTWKAGFFAPLGPVRTTAVSYVRLEPQSY